MLHATCHVPCCTPQAAGLLHATCHAARSVVLQASDKDRFLHNWTKPQHMWSTKAQLNEAEAQKAAKKAKEQADKLQPAPPAQKEPQAEVPNP